MVTGDQTAIARETSKQLGLGTNMVDASALGDTEQQPGSQIIECLTWCPEGDLNPHTHRRATDFKSAASANFAIRASPASALVQG